MDLSLFRVNSVAKLLIQLAEKLDLSFYFSGGFHKSENEATPPLQ